MNNIFIKPEYMQILINIFDKYCPEAEIWAYGSRIKNEAHSGSDLDLTVKSFNNAKCNIIELKRLINESNIPFLVDINEFSLLTETFQKEIMNKYVKIYGN